MEWVRSVSKHLGWRWEILLEGGCLTLAERLSYVAPRMGVSSLDELFRRRLGTADDGALYFAIGGDRIFFEPDHAVDDPDAVVRGAITILREAYVNGPDFFSEQVDLAPGDVALDLGGNFGTSALAFARRVGPSGRVVSFEPIFAAPLRRTLTENGVDNVTVIPEAVGDEPGEVDFYVTDFGIDSRLSHQPRTGTRRRVPMTTLDRFVSEAGLESVDFIKADIEGAEELALCGAREVIERFRPKWSIASYHTDPDGDAQHPKLVRRLRALGYEVETLEGEHIYAW